MDARTFIQNARSHLEDAWDEAATDKERDQYIQTALVEATIAVALNLDAELDPTAQPSSVTHLAAAPARAPRSVIEWPPGSAS